MFFKYLHTKLIHAYMYYVGVRLYSTDHIVLTNLVNQLTVETEKNVAVTFSFYLEKLTWFVYKDGRVKKKERDIFVITAKVKSDDKNHEGHFINKYGLSVNKNFLFSEKGRSWYRVFTSLYIDFIETKL